MALIKIKKIKIKNEWKMALIINYACITNHVTVPIIRYCIIVMGRLQIFFFTVLQVLVSISYLTLINAETASSDKKILIYVHVIIARKTSIDRCGLSVSTVLHPEYCFNKHLLMTYREQPLPRKPIKNVRKAKTKTTIINIRSLHHLLSPTLLPIWASILTR